MNPFHSNREWNNHLACIINMHTNGTATDNHSRHLSKLSDVGDEQKLPAMTCGIFALCAKYNDILTICATGFFYFPIYQFHDGRLNEISLVPVFQFPPCYFSRQRISRSEREKYTLLPPGDTIFECLNAESFQQQLRATRAQSVMYFAFWKYSVLPMQPRIC